MLGLGGAGGSFLIFSIYLFIRFNYRPIRLNPWLEFAVILAFLFQLFVYVSLLSILNGGDEKPPAPEEQFFWVKISMCIFAFIGLYLPCRLAWLRE
jgi:hypothetical protein